jgi:hypothetical protein
MRSKGRPFKKGDWDLRFTKKGTRVVIKNCTCEHCGPHGRPHLATIVRRSFGDPGRFVQTLDGSDFTVSFRQEELELVNALDRIASEI